MADLVYNPTYYPVSNGSQVVAVGLRELFYSETSPASSLAIVNGGLDIDNLLPAFKVLAEHTQRGSMVDMEATAGTANLDYVGFWFAGYDSTGTWLHSADLRPEARSIPGGCRRVYVASRSVVRVSWTVMFTNDNDSTSLRSRVFLDIDGTIQNGQMRQVHDVMDAGVHEGYARNRAWCGHAVAVLDPGWHDLSLKVVSDRAIRQTRVWARSINVLRFHLGES